MIKLCVGLCRKVSDKNYGSKGGNVSLEGEVDSNLLGDPSKLQAHIHHFFDLVRKALDKELQGQEEGNQEGARDQNHQSPFAVSEVVKPSQNGSVRLASEKQLSLIQSLLRKGKLPFQPLLDERKVDSFNEMTVQQASGVITELKAKVG